MLTVSRISLFGPLSFGLFVDRIVFLFKNTAQNEKYIRQEIYKFIISL